MLRLSLASLFASVALGGWLLSPVVRAEETASDGLPSSSITFSAWVENGEFIGDEQLRRLYVSSGTNKFGFLIPSGLRVDISQADRVTLMQPDLSYFITLRINAGVPLGADDFRRQVLLHYSGALLIEETSAEAAGRRGPMFNLRWKPAEGTDRVVTVAYIPNAIGILEFSVVAEFSKSAEAQSALIALLGRLQSSERGRLRMETFRQPDYN